MEGKIVYFEDVGREDREAIARIAEETLSLVRERAEELGIKTILVASTRGDTAAKAVSVFKGAKVIAVSHMVGHREPNTLEFTEENRRIVESKGGVVLTTRHAFGGFARGGHDGGGSGSARQPSNEPGAIIGRTLSIFGAGMKVACEIALMAADAGLVRTDEDVIAIAGSGRGANTAVVLRPANTVDFSDMRIKEILCKPHLAVARRREPIAAGEHQHH
ncbi:MAG: hypothetical protein HY663_06910 [Chloroflexi bacterium]|nr:hypothetical protein [Chloroflexota bacterium]